MPNLSVRATISLVLFALGLPLLAISALAVWLSSQAGQLALLVYPLAGLSVLGLGAAWWLAGQQITGPLAALARAVEKLAGGALEGKMPGLGLAGEIGAIAQGLESVQGSLRGNKSSSADLSTLQTQTDAKFRAAEAQFAEAAQGLNRVVEGVGRTLHLLSQGDLTARYREDVPDTHKKIQADLNQALDLLQQTLLSVAGNTSAVHEGAAELTQASDDLARRTEQQAATLAETATALGEITASVSKTAESVAQAQKIMATAKEDAERSGTVLRATTEAMSGIESSSQQIANIIGVIDEIAFQTNLLALNAGVEAARAGDAGRGFAVVATEVRALAQRSADASKEIKSLISASGAQVGNGVKMVDETGNALTRIAGQVTALSALMQEISQAARQQATGLSEVNSAVNQMDQVTQQNAAMVEQSTAASHALSTEAEELSRAMGAFNLGETVAAAPRRAAHRIVSRTTAPAAPRPAAKAAPKPAGGFRPVPGPAKPSAPVPAGTEDWDEF